MPKIATDIPGDLYKKIEEDVMLGIFPDITEAINATLRNRQSNV